MQKKKGKNNANPNPICEERELIETKGSYSGGLTMDWQKEKPKLTKPCIILCYSKVGMRNYAYAYDVIQTEDGLQIIYEDETDILDYDKFNFLFYKIIDYPERSKK